MLTSFCGFCLGSISAGSLALTQRVKARSGYGLSLPDIHFSWATMPVRPPHVLLQSNQATRSTKLSTSSYNFTFKKIILAFLVLCFLFVPSFLEASEVYVRGQRGAWYLEVDGEPFYVKGVGCGLSRGRNGEDYLKLAKDMGANSVRTWGTDQGTGEYLSLANHYGLKVAAGIWLNYVDDQGRCSYLHDEEYKKSKREEVLAYVRKYKDHPAVLMWVVGNEAIFFTKKEVEKIALCNFLEGLIREIHQMDPYHPVVYASATIADLPYLVRYVPSLDIIGMNEYGSIRTAHGTWDYLKFNKPYVFTEYGHYISLDRPKDINNRSVELSDQQKAQRYRDFSQQIHSFKGYNLGGFVFHLGETTQESMTWWNLNEGELKRASFWTIYEFYTGNKAPFEPIRIKKFLLSKIKDVKPAEMIEASVELVGKDRDDLTFEYFLSSSQENILKYYVNKYIPVKIFNSGPSARIKAPSKKGVYRVYGFVKDKNGNVTSANKSIHVR